MSSALAIGRELRPTPRRAACAGTGPRPRTEPDGAPSLERVISSAWEGLAARSAVACPVCAGQMLAPAGAGIDAEASIGTGGRCGGCGAELN